MLAVSSPDWGHVFYYRKDPLHQLNDIELHQAGVSDYGGHQQLHHTAPTFSPKRGAVLAGPWFSDNQPGGQTHCSARALQSSLTLQPPIRCVFPPKASQTPAPGSEHSSQVPNSARQNQVSVPVTAAAAQRAQTPQPS